jgi:hypothetical protein
VVVVRCRHCVVVAVVAIAVVSNLFKLLSLFEWLVADMCHKPSQIKLKKIRKIQEN